MTSNKRTTEPAVEPVSAQDLDTQLRGDGVLESVDSDLLESLIVAAREYVELFTRRALVNQTWTLYLDNWPSRPSSLGWWDGVREGSLSMGYSDHLELPTGPLRSVTSIKTFHLDNTEEVFASSNYFLDLNSNPGRVVLNPGAVWPTATRSLNSIEVVYVAGYGEAATDVPAPLRLAVKMLAAHWYENREYVKTQSDQNQASCPIHIQSLLNRYKVVRL